MPRYSSINAIFLSLVTPFCDPTKGIRKEMEIFTQQREQSIARKCRKNWRGYHGTNQLPPSINACVIMTSAAAKAHTKELQRVLLQQGLRIAETRFLQLHMGYVCCVWKRNQTLVRSGKKFEPLSCTHRSHCRRFTRSSLSNEQLYLTVGRQDGGRLICEFRVLSWLQLLCSLQCENEPTFIRLHFNLQNPISRIGVRCLGRRNVCTHIFPFVRE
jgi:hypothetical protein